jgi:hypothetical protein
MARPPNCFLVGAPKAGTTLLYYYLAQHPQIYMSPSKEPNFFASEIRLENFEPRMRRGVARNARELRRYMSGPMQQRRLGALVTEWEDYTRLFANEGGEPVRGEASVCYLWSSTGSVEDPCPAAARQDSDHAAPPRGPCLFRLPAWSQYRIHPVEPS